MAGFEGKDVSIKLKRDLGIFQGKIITVCSNSITIANAFHNGIRMKKSPDVEIGQDEIEDIEFLAVCDPATASKSIPAASTRKNAPKQTLNTKSPASFNHQSSSDHNSPFAKPFKPVQNVESIDKASHKTTKPIPIVQKASSNNFISASAPQTSKPELIKQKNKKKHNTKNYELMQPDDFSEEDFDFEGNLALFDKRKIFREIDNENIFGTKGNSKPDLVRQLHKPEEKYRHDENVLDSLFMQFRNVQLEFKPMQEYTTDEAGIIIPSIPLPLRNRIQNLANDHGHSMDRQNDFLARGATELALNLLGGSRRLSPKNLHQWPRVVIICDEPYNFRRSEVGLATARQLASHGLKVMVYVKTSSHSDKNSKELELFTATGNEYTGNAKDLFQSDLVIMSVSSMNQSSQIIRYIQQNRAQVMAIDPPATGISEVPIRNAVLPILPLDDIQNTCGKLHLVNICISEKFFKDAGIEYSPIFGSKFVIPLHLRS